MTIFSSDILKGFHAYSLLGSDDKAGDHDDTDNHRSPTPIGSNSEAPESTPEVQQGVTASKGGTIDSYRPGFFSRAPLNNEPMSVPESDPQPIRTRGPDSKKRGQSPEPISTQRGHASKPMSIQDQISVKHLVTSRTIESRQELGTRNKKAEPGLLKSGMAVQLSNQQIRDQQSSSNKGPASEKGKEESGVRAWHSLLESGAKGGNDGKSTGKTRLQGRIVQKGLFQTGKFLASFSFWYLQIFFLLIYRFGVGFQSEFPA
jgi:hypothetical protein